MDSAAAQRRQKRDHIAFEIGSGGAACGRGDCGRRGAFLVSRVWEDVHVFGEGKREEGREREREK